MAIKAGQILHAMNQFVVDRIQTGGPGNLNIPTERIYELGNYESVAIVRDIPDLSFNLDCLDVGTEVEALLTKGESNYSTDPDADADGTMYDLNTAKPIDIVSPWKPGQTAASPFQAVRGVAIPQLSLESASYRYGLRDNAGETFTLRGDSIFYTPAHPWTQVEPGDGVTTAFTFDADGSGPHTASTYNAGGTNTYALNVSVNGEYQRLGVDYTETSSGITFTTAPANGAVIRIVYAADVGDYPQDGNDPYGHVVHQGVSVKPAAIKGKDIRVLVGTAGATPTLTDKWTDVQSFNLDWRLTLEDDFEFDNAKAVSREPTGPPELSGSVELKPQTVEALFAKLEQITGVTAGQVIGPQSSVQVPLAVQLKNPGSGGTSAVAEGAVLKTLYVEDARFSIPGYEGRANQKLVQTINFESDTGDLKVYKGDPFGL